MRRLVISACIGACIGVVAYGFITASPWLIMAAAAALMALASLA